MRCPNCGVDLGNDTTCNLCGTAFGQEEEIELKFKEENTEEEHKQREEKQERKVLHARQEVPAPTKVEILDTLPFKISLTRVFIMTFLSSGMYLFYWFYLTWRQYRDHTNATVFPVWHTLALCVPIYGWFRFYAHIRSFNELIVKVGLSDTIKVGIAVCLFAISNSLDWRSFKAGLGETTEETALLIIQLDFLSVAVTAGLLLYFQGKLNRYWSSLANVRLKDARIGIGEVIFAVIGILFWLDISATLLSPSYRLSALGDVPPKTELE